MNSCALGSGIPYVASTSIGPGGQPQAGGLPSPPASPTALQHSYPTPSPFDTRLRRRTTLEEKEVAWKYRGYRAFSKWMSSENDFFVIRKFGTLNARCILLMQDDIQWLEEQLDKLDLDGEADESHMYHAGRVRSNHPLNREKRRILGELTLKLDQYNRFVFNHSEIKKRPEATIKQRENLTTWFDNNSTAIDKPEQRFVEADGDLMTLVPKNPVPLRRWIERYLSPIIECKIFREKRPYGSSDESTIYNKESRIDAVLYGLVVTVGVAMLLGPLWLLQKGYEKAWTLSNLLWIITSFILLFTLLLGTVTVAKPFETLAAVAAYAAVLTVFLQIAGGRN